MPTLPTAEQLGRVTVSARSGVLDYSTQGAQRIAQATADSASVNRELLEAQAEKFQKQQEERERIDLLKAESYTLQATTALEKEIRDNPDWEKNPQVFAERFEEIRRGALNLVPASKREEFNIGLNNIRTKGLSSVETITKDRRLDHYIAVGIDTQDKNTIALSAALSQNNENAAKAILKNQMRYNQFLLDSQAISETDYAKNNIEMPQNMLAAALDSLPPDIAWNIVKPKEGQDPAPAVAKDIIPQVIDESEGGFVAVDGASGQPAIYGINRKYHQAAFEEAERITYEQGEAAGKAYAADFYKSEYWDKYNLGDFDSATSRVLFDGVINHSASFRQKLVDSAKAGASPDELIEMRRQEYARLSQSAQYAPSYKGWMNRLENLALSVEGAQAPSSSIASVLRPNILAETRQNIYKKLEAERTKTIVNEMTFATADRERALLSQYSDNPTIVAAYEKKRKALKEDPAGYVTNHPEVVVARERAAAYMDMEGSSEAQKALFYQAYYEKIKDVQRGMGLPEHQIRVVPATEALEVVDVLNNEASTEDQMLQAIDPFVQRYGSDGLLALRENGVSGATFSLAGMKPGQDRDYLARAIKDGGQSLEKIVGNDTVKDVNKKVVEETESYTQAIIEQLPGGAGIAADTQEAVKLLALKYAAGGMGAGEAVKRAAENVVYKNYDVIDTVIVPTGTSRPAVREFLGDKDVILNKYDIYVPPQASGAPEQYKANLYRDAVVKTVGDKFYFYGPDGQPLLDSRKVQTGPDGRVSNPGEAAIFVPIKDAVSQTQRAAYEEVRVKEAQIAQKTGLKVQKQFIPNASFFYRGQKYTAPFASIQSPGRGSVSVFDKEEFDLLPDTGKAAAKKRIKQAVEYTQAFRESLPDEQKSQFDEIYKINQNIAREIASGARTYDIQTMRTYIGPLMVLEVPDWAK